METEVPGYTLKIRSGCAGGGKGALVQTEKVGTLSTLQDQTIFQAVPVLNDQGGSKMDVTYGVTGTLREAEHGHHPIVLCQERGNGVRCASFIAGAGSKANGIGFSDKNTPTLRSSGGLSMMPTVICRGGGQANAQTLENCSPTLVC